MRVERWVNRLGVQVVTGEIGALMGAYMVEMNVILLNERLAPLQRRSTLAHELGHAFFKHPGTAPHWERQASEWAARILISRRDFLEVSRVHREEVAMANELGVLPRDVKHYMNWVARNPLLTLSVDLHKAGVP